MQARADRVAKRKICAIAHAVGGSSTGVQHRRGLLLQAQGGEAHRRYRPGRRQQLDRPVSGSRVGPDTDQSSSALLAQGQGLSGRVRIVLRKGGAVSHDRAPWEGVRGARCLDFLAGSGCRHKRWVSESKTTRAAAEQGWGWAATDARAPRLPRAERHQAVRGSSSAWLVGCWRGGAPPRPAASGCRLPATAGRRALAASGSG
eukprot:COSAG04_NODE_2729_length_3668_cov_15.543009_1_plen_203_part_00